MSLPKSDPIGELSLPVPEGGNLGLLRDLLVFETERRLSRRDGRMADILRRVAVPQRVRRLSAFEDAHRGEDCFILGNGPSLNRTDLSLLAGRHCIGLNKIHLILSRQALDLSYLVSVNPFVVTQSVGEFSALGVTTFLPAEFCRRQSRRNPHFQAIRARDGFRFNTRMSGNFGQGHTVTFVALQIAFAMGFERVFLVGVDHSFKQAGRANEIQKMEQGDENHFDPSYFQGQLWHLADLEASEIAYRIAELEYRRAGRQVFDATVDGMLTIFEKMPYVDAVGMSRARARPPLHVERV